MANQRSVSFNYELRTDVAVEYFGGSKIVTDRRLKEIRYFVNGAVKGIYEIGFDYSPLTELSRVVAITLVDEAGGGAQVNPLKFSWVNGQPNVFDPDKALATLPFSGTDVQIIPIDVNAEGESDVVIPSTRQNPANSNQELYIDVFLADSEGGLSDTPTPGSGFSGLPPPTTIFALDADGDGRTDLVRTIFFSSAKFLNF